MACLWGADRASERQAAQAADLALHDVSLGYRNAIVVSRLSGRFTPGSLTAIVGPNGAGKTTLLKGMLGLVRPVSGRVECPWPSRAMAYLSQGSEVDRGFPITVSDFVCMGLWNRIGSLRAVGPALRRCVDSAIADVGLQGLENAWIGDLSGGQFQRVRFARLLVQDAPVVLLDEPFAGIDAPTVLDLLDLIGQWHAQARTVVAVLHDLDIVRTHFPRTLALSGRACDPVVGWGETEGCLQALAQSGRLGRAGRQSLA